MGNADVGQAASLPLFEQPMDSNGKLAGCPTESQMHVVGLDIGGANLKAADAGGRAVTRPFAVWKAPEKLAAEVGRLLRRSRGPMRSRSP